MKRERNAQGRIVKNEYIVCEVEFGYDGKASYRLGKDLDDEGGRWVPGSELKKWGA